MVTAVQDFSDTIVFHFQGKSYPSGFCLPWNHPKHVTDIAHIEFVQEDVTLPHLERLCLHLGDHSRDNDDVNHVSIFNHHLPSHSCTCIQVECTRNRIVTGIATLAVAYEEARAVSLSSDTLANALVSRLNHLTSLLWEDSVRTMPSDEVINDTSRALNRTLSVFHYLLFANHLQAPFDLIQKIKAAPLSAARDHMFNVTFGRLSFALDLKNVPEEAQRVLGRIVNSSEYRLGMFFWDRLMEIFEGMASDILQLVVDMPEDEDLIWLACQDEEPSGDEEEARMMEANEV